MVAIEFETSDSRVNRYNGKCSKSNWSGINIAAMVAAFVLFWPMGLFMVYWICSGRDARELPGIVKGMVDRVRGQRMSGTGNSYNRIFDEYQQTQFDRISEIKAEIQERSKRFNEFREEQKRKHDQDEFNLFMTLSPAKGDQ